MTKGKYTGAPIAGYTLGDLLGEGGFGEVYEAIEPQIGKKVAVKLLLRSILHPERESDTNFWSTVDIENFWKEAHTLAVLDGHQNIVRVLHFGIEEGQGLRLPYMVMEFAPGGSLLARHPPGSRVPLGTVVSYTRQAASALQFAHDANIVHHDVKPANLLIGANGQILLSDFGIAEVNHATVRVGSEEHRGGTSVYMPPEKIKSGWSRKAGDQYSLAVVVYQWIAGRLPFNTLEQAEKGQLISLDSVANVSPAVAQVVMRGLNKDPDRRYQRVEDFAIALEQAATTTTATTNNNRGQLKTPRQPNPVRDALETLVYSAAMILISLVLGNLGKAALQINGGLGQATINGSSSVYLVILAFGVLPLVPQLAGKLLGVWRGAFATLLYLVALNVASRIALPELISLSTMWHDMLFCAPMIPVAIVMGYAYTTARATNGNLGCWYAGFVSFVTTALFWYLVILLSNGLTSVGVGVVEALTLAVPLGLVGGILDMLIFNALLIEKNGKVFYPTKVVATLGICVLLFLVVSGGSLFFTNTFGATNYYASDLHVQVTSKALDSYWDSAGNEHIDYIDSKGHIHELSGHPGGKWSSKDLTALSKGASAATGSLLAGYQGNDGQDYINFVGRNGHVYELSYSTGGKWRDSDLTVLSGGRSAAAGSALAGYPGNDGSIHVNFIGTNGHIQELYFIAGKWSDNDLMALSGGTPAALKSGLAGYVGNDGSVHVNYLSSNGHVHELYWLNGWSDNDLTALSNGRPAISGSGLTGYMGSGNSIRVDYIGTDKHIHELYWSGKWSNNDLTRLGKGKTAASGSTLSGYPGEDKSVHVNYIGTDGHIHELSLVSGNWRDIDLTALSKGSSPAAKTPLAGYWDHQGNEYVSFIGVNGHVDEDYT